MLILAIDTSMGAAAVCVQDSSKDAPAAAERILLERGHAEVLVPLIDRVMRGSGSDFADLSRVAVVVGPGSFTGIRVGVAAARAIGLATGADVVGVSSLAAFAAPHVGRPGILVSAIDARHGNVYVQSFDVAGATVSPASICSVRDAVRRLGSSPITVVGTGASMIAIEAWSQGLSAEIVGDGLSPEIGFVARLGLLADPLDDPPRPLYLKAADVTLRSDQAVRRA